MDNKIKMVGKIGSMALIRPRDMDIDYNIMSRLGEELEPGMIWVSSGATEIGRLDYIKRRGCELTGDPELVKADYAAQGQAILMENYRRFIPPGIAVRQLLVEHTHFNDPLKRKHIRNFLLRAPEQGVVPIVNYNDPVSFDEIVKVELDVLRRKEKRVVECIDNDETAAVISHLVKSPLLVILTSVDGIYRVPNDPSTLIHEITGKNPRDLKKNIQATLRSCKGASRLGAGGAFAKLSYIIPSAMEGTHVIIGHARHRISDLVNGRVPCTHIGLEL